MNVHFIIISALFIGLWVFILLIKYFVSDSIKDEYHYYETNQFNEFKIPETESDYNEIQNLSEYNKGTYRDKSGKFKSIDNSSKKK